MALANCWYDNRKFIGHCERGALVCFQSDLLRKHDVGPAPNRLRVRSTSLALAAIFANFLHVGPPKWMRYFLPVAEPTTSKYQNESN
jgi:hypothetical protein